MLDHVINLLEHTLHHHTDHTSDGSDVPPTSFLDVDITNDIFGGSHNKYIKPPPYYNKHWNGTGNDGLKPEWYPLHAYTNTNITPQATACSLISWDPKKCEGQETSASCKPDPPTIYEKCCNYALNPGANATTETTKTFTLGKPYWKDNVLYGYCCAKHTDTWGPAIYPDPSWFERVFLGKKIDPNKYFTSGTVKSSPNGSGLGSCTYKYQFNYHPENTCYEKMSMRDCYGMCYDMGRKCAFVTLHVKDDGNGTQGTVYPIIWDNTGTCCLKQWEDTNTTKGRMTDTNAISVQMPWYSMEQDQAKLKNAPTTAAAIAPGGHAGCPNPPVWGKTRGANLFYMYNEGDAPNTNLLNMRTACIKQGHCWSGKRENYGGPLCFDPIQTQPAGDPVTDYNKASEIPYQDQICTNCQNTKAAHNPANPNAPPAVSEDDELAGMDPKQAAHAKFCPSDSKNSTSGSAGTPTAEQSDAEAYAASGTPANDLGVGSITESLGDSMKSS